MPLQDISDAMKLAAKTAGEVGMTKADLQKAADLLQKYGAGRDELCEKLASLLEKTDVSNLDGDWKDLCGRGRELLSSLNDAVPPPDGEGLAGIGLDAFYRGELKIWDENAKADIAFAAKVMRKVLDADCELIKKCEQDLQTVRDGDKVVEALVEKNFGGLQESMKSFLLLKTANVAQVFTHWLKDPSAKIYVRQWADYIRDRLKENLDAAKQKRAIKQQILDNIQLLQGAKEQLSEEWLDAVNAKGAEFARGLPDTGRSADYKAADWADFAETCCKTLADSCEGAKEQSKRVFDDLLPTFIEENTRAFAALTDDPSKLDDFTSSMQDDFKSLDEAFASEDETIDDLADGPYKQAARETYDELRTIITASLQLFISNTKDTEDEMKE
jgi:hypothetical protein